MLMPLEPVSFSSFWDDPKSMLLTGGAAIIVALLSLFLLRFCSKQSEEAEHHYSSSYQDIPDTILSHMITKQQLAEFSGEVDYVIIGSGLKKLSISLVLNLL